MEVLRLRLRLEPVPKFITVLVGLVIGVLVPPPLKPFGLIAFLIDLIKREAITSPLAL